jgi:hypothetical protein
MVECNLHNFEAEAILNDSYEASEKKTSSCYISNNDVSKLSTIFYVNWIFPVTFFIQGASIFFGIQV